MPPQTPDPNVPQAAPSDPTQQDGGGFFSRLGAGLKKVMPYVTPIANRLAAAAGNYGPMELEHQQKEQQLEAARQATQEQLAQSQMQTQELNRQLLSKQIGNVRTPEEAEALHVKQTGEEEAARAANAPGTVAAAPLPTGGYGQFRIKGTQATPITTTTQVPNPDLQPYADVAAGGAPPNLVQDWNAGPPPTMPKTVDQTSQLMAIPKGMTKGQPLRQPDGSYAVPVFDAQQHIHHYETLEGTPLPQVPQTTYAEHTVLKDTPQGQVPVTLPSSTTKGPAGPSAPSAQPPASSVQPPAPQAPGGPTWQNPSVGAAQAPPTMPGRSASRPPMPPGVHAGAPLLHSKQEQQWVSWTDEHGRQVAGPNSMAAQAGAQNPTQVPMQEVRDITNARFAVNLMTKQGDPNKPETQGVLQLLDSLDRDGKLGILASRWNAFMTQRVGAAPGDDPRIVTLINKNMLSDTATMLAHFGASGGRSPQMLQHFLDLANAGKMDGPTLKAGTLAMADYMKDRAMMPGPQGASSLTVPPSILSPTDWLNQQKPH